jgi:transposase
VPAFLGGLVMGHRHAISDADWDRVKDLLPGRPGQTGWVARDNRRFLDAVLYVAKTGIPWRDLPERFGAWGTVWKRFDRWSRKGTWAAVFVALQDPDLEWLILDSTVIRAHPSAAGAKKKRTGPGVRASRRWGRAGAGSGPRSMSL